MAKRKTPSEFEKDFYNKFGDAYVVMSEYKNSRTPVTLKHRVCDTTFKVTPKTQLHGTNLCPICFPKRILLRLVKKNLLVS